MTRAVHRAGFRPLLFASRQLLLRPAALKIAALLAVVFTGAAAAWHGHTRPTAFLPPENKTVLAATERHPMAVESQPSILPNVSRLSLAANTGSGFPLGPSGFT